MTKDDVEWIHTERGLNQIMKTLLVWLLIFILPILIQNNIFHHAEFETMKLDSSDVQIDLKEYIRDEEKKDIKSKDYEMEM